MISTIPQPQTPKIVPSSDRLIPEWVSMSWEEYESWREREPDDPQQAKRAQWYFDRHLFLVRDMGWEGINHAKVKDLLILIFGFWFALHPEVDGESLSGGLLEKPGLRAAAPDLMIYTEGKSPVWEPGEPRRINLDRWSVPALVGEISDTTLASDLDEVKQIYAAMGIPEYWVVDVLGRRVLMFELVDDRYSQMYESRLISGVTTELLEATLDRCMEVGNISAAIWFQKRLAVSTAPTQVKPASAG